MTGIPCWRGRAPWCALRRLLPLILVAALCVPPAAVAAAATPAPTPDGAVAPGASGTARLGETSLLYARRGDGAVWVRAADGLRYSDWSPLGFATDAPPAAAGAGRVVAVFARGIDGAVWATRTPDGATYEAWRSLGGTTKGSPAAVGHGGRIHLFARGEDDALYTTIVDAGPGDGDSARWVRLGGTLTTAPVATESNGTLTVFGRGAAGESLYRDGRDDGRGQMEYGPWRVRAPGSSAPGATADQSEGRAGPPTLDAGINFISAHDWESYQLPAYEQMRPTLAKFSMFYDPTPFAPMFGTRHLDDAIARGARTIIFRTAETRIRPDDVERQLNTPLLDEDGREGLSPPRSMLEYVRDHHAAGSGVEFWIEVGNEPDLAGLNPRVARWLLLDTIRTVAPRYRESHPNLRWMASLPTKDGLAGSGFAPYRGVAYLDLLLADEGDGLGSVPGRYDALGVHLYGNDTLEQPFPLTREPEQVFDCGGGNGDSACPTVVLDRVLSRTDRPIFVTEAGINSSLPWRAKSRYYVEAIARMPSRVRGFALFTLSRDPEWYAGTGPRCQEVPPRGCTRYAIDVNEFGRVDRSFAGAAALGGCAALPNPRRPRGLDRPEDGGETGETGCQLPCPVPSPLAVPTARLSGTAAARLSQCLFETEGRLPPAHPLDHPATKRGGRRRGTPAERSTGRPGGKHAGA